MNREEPLCVRCARTQRTCCQISEIYITPGDLERIAAYTGESDFFEYRRPANPEYLDQSDDPLWAACVFRPDGTRRVLRRSESEGCLFLGPGGCRLPLEVRPLVCRLYPFDYTEQGLQSVNGTMCPIQLLAPGVTLLQSLGMDAEMAEEWRSQLYAEIRQELPASESSSAIAVTHSERRRDEPRPHASFPDSAAVAPARPSPEAAAVPKTSSPCTSV
ncbi:MAG: YkgJ family cysteine cluster protein [Thermogutta sp.]